MRAGPASGRDVSLNKCSSDAPSSSCDAIEVTPSAVTSLVEGTSSVARALPSTALLAASHAPEAAVRQLSRRPPLFRRLSRRACEPAGSQASTHSSRISVFALLMFLIPVTGFSSLLTLRAPERRPLCQRPGASWPAGACLPLFSRLWIPAQLSVPPRLPPCLRQVRACD